MCLQAKRKQKEGSLASVTGARQGEDGDLCLQGRGPLRRSACGAPSLGKSRPGRPLLSGILSACQPPRPRQPVCSHDTTYPEILTITLH